MLRDKHTKCPVAESWIAFGKKLPCLARWITVSETIALNSFCLRSKSSIVLETQRHLALPYFIIHPLSKFRFFWETWMILIYFIGIIFIPYEATVFFFTLLNPNNYKDFRILFIFLHLMFFLDIIINLCTGIIQEKTKRIILERNTILWNYLKTYFVFDLISTAAIFVNFIPWYFIKPDPICPNIVILNFMKLCKILLLFKYCENVASCFGMYSFGISMNVFRIITVSIFFFHITACLMYTIPCIFYNVHYVSYNVWQEEYRVDMSSYSVFQFYVNCFLIGLDFVMATSAHLRAETNMEFGISIVFLVLGMLYQCFLFVQLLDIIRYVMETETKYDEFLNQLRGYIHQNQLPVNIQQRMFLYYEYRYQKTYFHEPAIMSTLPQNLANELKLQGVKNMITTVDLFQHVHPEIINGLLTHFIHRIYLPKDAIIKYAKRNQYVHFINHGTVGIYTKYGGEVMHFHDGQYFGIIMNVVYTCIAIEICDIYLLEKEVLYNALREYPELMTRMLEEASERLKLILGEEQFQSFGKSSIMQVQVSHISSSMATMN